VKADRGQPVRPRAARSLFQASLSREVSGLRPLADRMSAIHLMPMRTLISVNPCLSAVEFCRKSGETERKKTARPCNLTKFV
jgi:hypothetical protein